MPVTREYRVSFKIEKLIVKMTDDMDIKDPAKPPTIVVPLIENTGTIFSIVVQENPEYNSAFAHVRVYGTTEKPLFVAKDIQDLLQLKDMRYSRADGGYKWIKDKVMIKAHTRKGYSDVVALTEEGLMKALHDSKTDIALKFQTFVFVAIKRLVMTGSVTMKQAVSDTKHRLEELQLQYKLEREENERLFMESEEYKRQAIESKLDARYIAEQYTELAKQLEYGNKRDPDVADELIKKIKNMYCKPIYVMINKPPKDVEEDGWAYDWEIPDPMPDDQCIVSFQTTPESKTKTLATTKLWIHKHQTIDVLHKAMNDRWIPVPLKKNGEAYTNMYIISMDELVRISDEIFEEELPELGNTPIRKKPRERPGKTKVTRPLKPKEPVEEEKEEKPASRVQARLREQQKQNRKKAGLDKPWDYD